jgi:hypothetical protein
MLWRSVLQCNGLASREFFSDVTGHGRGSLVVCVCRGCLVYRVDTGWVGLDGMWECLCVFCVSFGGAGGAEGKCGWVLGRCIYEQWTVQRWKQSRSRLPGKPPGL